ncbi:two-component sensor histidine kinase, partial [Streptomyces sp. NPDC048551]
MTRGAGRRSAPWRRRRPLRTRLAIAVTAAVAFVAVGVCGAAFLQGRSALYGQLDLSLTEAARRAAEEYGNSPPGTASWSCQYLAAPACAKGSPRDQRRRPYIEELGKSSN